MRYQRICAYIGCKVIYRFTCIARDCKVTPTVPHTQISSPAKPDLAIYTMSTFIKKSFDEHDFPLFHVLSQSYIENKVFTVPRIPVAEEVEKPTGCLWAMSETPKGQQMLTVWDTFFFI